MGVARDLGEMCFALARREVCLCVCLLALVWFDLLCLALLCLLAYFGCWAKLPERGLRES